MDPEGILNKVLSWGGGGGSAHRSNLLPIFDRKGTPFVYLLLMVPLHIPSLVLIACLSSAINLLCNVFLIQVNHKNRTFSRLIHSHRIHLLALLGLFTERNDRFYHPLKCLLYHKPRKREKVNPFGRNILVETIIGSNPPPPPSPSGNGHRHHFHTRVRCPRIRPITRK